MCFTFQRSIDSLGFRRLLRPLLRIRALRAQLKVWVRVPVKAQLLRSEGHTEPKHTESLVEDI